MQTVDVFGMALFNEPVWVSGRPGEARMCGGCHEDRTKTTNVNPGLLDTFAAGATDLMSGSKRSARINQLDPEVPSANPTAIVGVGWDTQVQPIFTTSCVGCHNATTNTNLGAYEIQDATGKTIATWHLDLSATKVPPELAVVAGGGAFTASYFSMAGPDEEAIERNHLKVVGTLIKYMKPLDAHGSPVIQKLNPTQLFPAPGAARAFPTASNPPHLVAQGKTDLNSTQFYMLILAADMGVNFYARENNPMMSNP
jgi:cytochrome c553